MTLAIDSLDDIADKFDAIVLDQWGVLHDGQAPYPGAIAALERLKERGKRLAVLSNSGKRARPNRARIASMGFDVALFDVVMTSGEALWKEIAQNQAPHRTLFAVTRAPGDAPSWADGLDIALSDTLPGADAILLMGLPDGAKESDYADLLAEAHRRKLTILCTNPDRASPRAGGALVISPGALAHAYAEGGGPVRFYGKPHLPVFRAVASALAQTGPGPQSARILMVGDSLEHDIAGAASAGWASAFVRGGLHAAAFAKASDVVTTLVRLAAAEDAPAPDYTIAHLE
ncbi:MAG: TIGR01459 family HAD-type hydrolase [Pseudomonadota bacterium]